MKVSKRLVLDDDTALGGEIYIGNLVCIDSEWDIVIKLINLRWYRNKFSL